MAADRRNRRLHALPVIALIALGLAGPSAQGAPGVSPVAVGNYELAPEVDEGGTYSSGLFAVVKDDGVRTIVPSEGYDGIFYPDVGKCDGFSLPLVAKRIDVSPAGRFKIREKTPIEEGSIQVRWKGHWTKAKRVIGTITLKYDGCTSTEGWTGRRVAPTPPPVAE